MTPTIPDIEEAPAAEARGRKRGREGEHADARTSLVESCDEDDPEALGSAEG